MPKNYISNALKRLRERTGMKADDVGKIIGKSGKTVNAWENGRGQPDAETLIKLSVIYKVENLLSEFDELNELNRLMSDKYILNDDEKFVVDSMRTLNDTGIEYVVKQLRFAVEQPDYKKGSDDSAKEA